MKLDYMLFDKYEGRDVSVYATTETIDEFIDLFGIELENEEELNDVLNGEFAILSRLIGFDGKDFWLIEPLRYGRDNKQASNECEVALIEKGIAVNIDFSKIDYLKLDQFEDVVTYVEEVMEDNCEEVYENEERDYVSEWIDEIMEDMFYEIEYEGACPSCTIKKYMRIVYDSAKEDIVNDIIDYLEN